MGELGGGMLCAGKPNLKVEKIGPVYYLTNTSRGVKTWFSDFRAGRFADPRHVELIFHEDRSRALWFATEEQAAGFIPRRNKRYVCIINQFSRLRRISELSEGSV